MCGEFEVKEEGGGLKSNRNWLSSETVGVVKVVGAEDEGVGWVIIKSSSNGISVDDCGLGRSDRLRKEFKSCWCFWIKTWALEEVKNCLALIVLLELLA